MADQDQTQAETEENDELKAANAANQTDSGEPEQAGEEPTLEEVIGQLQVDAADEIMPVRGISIGD